MIIVPYNFWRNHDFENILVEAETVYIERDYRAVKCTKLEFTNLEDLTWFTLKYADYIL